MPFEIVIRKEIQNEISQYLDELPKKIIVANYTINNGLLEKAPYKIPLTHILFIKEIV